MGSASGYIVYIVQMINISTHFTLLTFLSNGLTSYCKLSMTLLAFLAVEVVHVGTQFNYTPL